MLTVQKSSGFLTAPPLPAPVSLADKAKDMFPVLDSTVGRRTVAGVSAAAGAAALLSLMRELQREKRLNYVYGGHGKPGKGDIVVRVPRRKQEEEQKRASLETALGLITAALATGGTYYGLTRLDDMRSDLVLARHEAKARDRFREALEAKHAASALDEVINDILPGDEKQAGLFDNMTTTMWLLAMGLGLSSAYVTKHLADNHYDIAKKQDLVIPPERRVVFQSYTPGEKRSSEPLADDYFKLALEVQKDLLRGETRFMHRPEFSGLVSKIAQAGGDVPAATGGLPHTQVLGLLNQLRRSQPEAFKTLLADPATMQALHPLVTSMIPEKFGIRRAANALGVVPRVMNVPGIQNLAQSKITEYLDSVEPGGKPFEAPGFGDVGKVLLSHAYGGVRDKFKGLFSRFAGPGTKDVTPSRLADASRRPVSTPSAKPDASDKPLVTAPPSASPVPAAAPDAPKAQVGVNIPPALEQPATPAAARVRVKS